jgi:hypothetical protein
MTHEEPLRAEGPAELQRMVIDQRKGELTRVGFTGIEKAFSEFGLPVIAMTEPPPLAEQQNVHRRLQPLSAFLIEHNRSVVNEELLRLVPDLPYSDRAEGPRDLLLFFAHELWSAATVADAIIADAR